MFIKEKQNESISTKLIFSKKVICEKIRSGNPLWLPALSRTPKKQKINRKTKFGTENYSSVEPCNQFKKVSCTCDPTLPFSRYNFKPLVLSKSGLLWFSIGQVLWTLSAFPAPSGLVAAYLVGLPLTGLQCWDLRSSSFMFML